MKRVFLMDLKGFRIIQYSEFEETHKDHQVLLLALHRSPQESLPMPENVQGHFLNSWIIESNILALLCYFSQVGWWLWFFLFFSFILEEDFYPSIIFKIPNSIQTVSHLLSSSSLQIKHTYACVSNFINIPVKIADIGLSNSPFCMS